MDPSQVPVVHSGGQSRPLCATSHWEPESAQSDSEVEVTAGQIVVPDSDVQGAFEGVSLSAPVSREAGSLRPRPSSSSSSSRLLTLTPIRSVQHQHQYRNLLCRHLRHRASDVCH